MVACIISACSKDDASSLVEKLEPSTKAVNKTLIQTAVVDTVIDPITIEILHDNQKTIVKLIGVATPNLAGNTKIYDFALNFTKFHLYKGKEVRLQKDIYNTNTNEEFQFFYLFIDGEMYNKLMLTNGYAVVSDIHNQFELKQEFQSIEQKAQDSNLGYWANQNGKINNPNKISETSNSNESAGTLPKIILTKTANQTCDYTQDNIPIIKGNYDKKIKTKTYYLPDSIFYKTIEISSNDGDRLFCTENEAKRHGWVKSKH